MTSLATLDCGNYGEDTLSAEQHADGSVALERTMKDGRTEKWPVAPTDTLRVSAEVSGKVPFVAMNTQLLLVSRCGSSTSIAHFEMNVMWGGVFDAEVAAFAQTIAAASGCTATILPTKYPPEAPVPPASAAAPPPPPPVPEPLPPPPELLADSAGVTTIAVLGSARALRLPDGSIIVEEATTGARWPIAATDVLRIEPYVEANAPFATYAALQRGRDRLTAHTGVEAARAFAAAIAAATTCSVEEFAERW